MASVQERFDDKYIPEPNSGCWLWTAFVNPCGYGMFRFGGRMALAHRVAYELLHGSIPKGKTLDHLCRTPCCVNPQHLEPVSLQVNISRGNGVGVVNAAKTHCPKGHPYTTENTRVTYGRRRCRICLKAASQRVGKDSA